MRKYLLQVVFFAAVFGAVVGYCRVCEWQSARAEVEVVDAATDLPGPYACMEVGMADWTVSGAGDASYNGDYTETGTANSKPYYVGGSGSRWLFWDTGQWCLGEDDSVGLHAYQGTGADLPASSWSVNAGVGTAPAPTVAAATPSRGCLTNPIAVLVTGNSYPNGAVVTVTGLNNTGAEDQYVYFWHYTATEPHTYAWNRSYGTYLAPGATNQTAQTSPIQCGPNGALFVLRADSDDVTIDLDGAAGYEVLSEVGNVVTIGQIDPGPDSSVADSTPAEAGESGSAYSTLLDIGDAESASAYTVHQRVVATFASAYTALVRPHVWARSNYGVFGAVSAEAASAYSTQGTVASRTFPSSYGVAGDAGDAEFATAYTVEGTVGGGPGMLMMMLLTADDA